MVLGRIMLISCIVDQITHSFIRLVVGALHSWNNWESYQLVTVHNHGNFIVLPNCVIRTTAAYATQSEYLATELSTLCPLLLMLNAMLGSDKCQFNNSLV